MLINNKSHLSYCTNIHPGNTWNAIFTNLEQFIIPIKQKLAPQKRFGIGLYLPQGAAQELSAGDFLLLFQQWLKKNNLYVFTLNGFPIGGFHSTSIKEQVYAPDWTSPLRTAYTLQLAKILAFLLPEEVEGGISTCPISYKKWIKKGMKEDVVRKAVENLMTVVQELVVLHTETGKLVHLDIEPEPGCYPENTEEFIAFYNDILLVQGATILEELMNITSEAARGYIKKFIRLCYDVCHFSVQYESPESSLARFIQSGIKIGKIQISSGLKLTEHFFHNKEQSLNTDLSFLQGSPYLHQVVEQRGTGDVYFYNDLPNALSGFTDRKAKEWRIHCHVPIFLKKYRELDTTRKDIIKTINMTKQYGLTKHLEIETYTWRILHTERQADLIRSIQNEYAWLLKQFSI